MTLAKLDNSKLQSTHGLSDPEINQREFHSGTDRREK